MEKVCASSSYCLFIIVGYKDTFRLVSITRYKCFHKNDYFVIYNRFLNAQFTMLIALSISNLHKLREVIYKCRTTFEPPPPPLFLGRFGEVLYRFCIPSPHKQTWDFKRIQKQKKMGLIAFTCMDPYKRCGFWYGFIIQGAIFMKIDNSY